MGVGKPLRLGPPPSSATPPTLRSKVLYRSLWRTQEEISATDWNFSFAGVKEAAERGTLKCRSLKEGYAGYLRQRRKGEESGAAPAAEGPEGRPESWSGFQCPDLLQPFLLACNYMDAGAKLTLLSLGGIQVAPPPFALWFKLLR